MRGFLLAAAMTMSIAGSWAAPAPLALALDGPRSSAWAPFLYAVDRGLFRSAGLDLAISSPGGPGSALASLAGGTADVCVADAAAAFAARAAGARVTVIASLGDRHPACIYATPDRRITGPKELTGKRLAVDPLSADRPALPLLLTTAGVQLGDLTLVSLDRAGRIAAVLDGSADAAVGRIDEEPLPVGLAAYPWADAGFAAYGRCLVATDDAVRSKAPALRAFLRTALAAWDVCLRQPDAAAAVVASTTDLAAATAAAWLRTERALFDTETYRKKGIGLLDRTRIQLTRDLVTTGLGLPLPYPAGEGWTAALLPAPPVLLRPIAAAAPGG
jgi:NitT/TauT family transport system substrate-binding protein